MKKRIGILLLVSVLCLLSSCYTYKNLEMEYDRDRFSKDYIVIPEGMPIPVHETDNETPYQELITKEIDIHDFVQENCLGIDLYSSVREISAKIGIECLRETEEGALYSVHKVKQGGLLYIAYDRHSSSEDTAETCFHQTVGCFYVQKKLSSKDFASIKEGSTIMDIKKIDPTTQVWENLYNAEPEDKRSYLHLYHYLSDGIMQFWLKETDGELKVISIELLSDFKTYTSFGIGLDYFPCKVLDQDLLW